MKSASRGKVLVGLSGGVDSSVAALRLLEQGYEIEGLFMKNWEEDDSKEYCSAAADLSDAMAVAEKLGIPLHTVNFSSEYWERVFAYFLDEYRAGRTPNPDVLCNREIKFKAFLDHALGLGAEKIATGHYARIAEADGRFHLQQAFDRNKDQTYFLYLLNQHQLAHALFPLGDIDKPGVRRLARAAGFPTHDKKDSTGICFIGERRFRDFLAKYLPAQPGEIETPEGEVIGTHQGLMYHTIGQRQGLRIGGLKGRGDAPWYVAGKDLERNVLIAVQGSDHPMLFASGLAAGDIHWITGEAPAFPLTCMARCRHRQPLQKCTVTMTSEESLAVKFNEPQRAMTPGQAIVFYEEETCLGGATIREVG
ncbi:MAG: tRNA 2-thiouridine(34) synthase MnmA [Chromatiales bacterium]